MIRSSTRSSTRHSTRHSTRTLIRTATAALFVVHGLILFMGFAKAFGLAEFAALTQPISHPVGMLWLAAAVLCWATAGALFLAPRWWWAVGTGAVVLSQIVIVTSWSDARFGTIVNVLLLVAVGYGFASRGPLSLRAAFADDLHTATDTATSTATDTATSSAPSSSASSAPSQLVTESDLASLPEPVQRYVRQSGAIGRPRVHDFRATWTGRIRADTSSEWMEFTAEQLNTIDTPRRFFLMDATMKHLPVDVLHAFDENGATMRVKVLSMFPMVDAKGPELTRAETVTMFNDLCLYAPGALTLPSITFEPIDDHATRAHFTLGVNTIAAELHFNDADELVDFVSDDRTALSPDGLHYLPMRWTTPAHDYTDVGPARVATVAETRWQPESGAWTYGEFRLDSLAYNVGSAHSVGSAGSAR
jgi:hypothetical protein